MLPPVFGALLAFVTSLFRAHASLRPENLVLRGAMAAERINVEEIRATGRARDATLDNLMAAVLETDGSFIVFRQVGHSLALTLAGMANYPSADR